MKLSMNCRITQILNGHSLLNHLHKTPPKQQNYVWYEKCKQMKNAYIEALEFEMRTSSYFIEEVENKINPIVIKY